MSSPTLSPAQVHALFDILTHYETYAEIQNFQWPQAIHEYGPPFKMAPDATPTSPLLQILLNKFVMKLPGLKSMSKDFWDVKIATIVEKLGAAELSQSYDKGTLGTRKTLATAVSAVLEYVARGTLGGYPKHDVDKERAYDLTKAEDILQGWDDFVQQIIYGDMIDELLEKVKQTDNLKDQPTVVQAAHEYINVNIAAFLHHVLILSPDGEYILRMLDNVHKLVPYSIARQTLKVGNAATMINGMIKLLLTKVSVTAFTNWIGISNSANDGMNLLQQIISTVLGWDIADFQKRAAKIEKNKNGPSQKHLDAIKAYLQKPRQDHEACRKVSQETPMSSVSVIFAVEAISDPLSEEQHSLAQEYLALLLSIRDREELINILCKSRPDNLTQAIRDGVSAYEPIIRSVHNAYDLSSGLSDVENFLNDLLKMSKPRKRSPSLAEKGSRNNSKQRSRSNSLEGPSVDDYLELVRRHQHAVHKFLHQVAKNGPEVTAMYHEWFHLGAAEFQATNTKGTPKGDITLSENGAGEMTDLLNSLFSQLSEEEKKSTVGVLDQHSDYLSKLAQSSHERMKSMISGGGETKFGPGMYLAKWQLLLDNTIITPATPNGPIRHGKDDDVSEASLSKWGNKRTTEVDAHTAARRLKGKEAIPDAPDVDVVVKLLQPKFRAALAERVQR